MKSAVAGLTAIVAAIIFVVVGIIGWSVGRGAVAAPVGAVAVQVQTTVPTHIYLTVATPDMLKTDVGPAVLPSGVTVPANSDVIVTILNFDGATPLTGAYTKFATAAGIEGKFTAVAINTANPNGPTTAPAKTLAAVDPAIVSHTFTIPPSTSMFPSWRPAVPRSHSTRERREHSNGTARIPAVLVLPVGAAPCRCRGTWAAS